MSERETDGRCVVCDKPLYELLEPVSPHVNASHGFYCRRCGLRYAKLPEVDANEPLTVPA